MKRAVLLVAFLLAAASAEPTPQVRKVKLSCTVAAADGGTAHLWAAPPFAIEGVQTTTAKERFVHAEGTSLTWEATVERREQRAPAGALESQAVGLTKEESAELAKFLEPEKGNEAEVEFQKLARSIAPDEKKTVAIARAIFEHVISNMKYDKPAGKAWGRGSVKWACSEKYGNCTDFHALFMNLCRARGIPARFTMGFSLPADKKGKVEGYHCWCEFYVSGSGWVPVDASEAWKHADKKDYYFGALDRDRVSLVLGRDLTLEPAQKAGPVSILATGYAERDGKPVAVKRELTFEDVD